MKINIFLFLLFISFNSFSQEKGTIFSSLKLGNALIDNSYLFSPELEASYTLIKDKLLINLNFGLWISEKSNYEYSKNGIVSNYQKIGFSYKLINNSKYIRNIKILNKNGNIKIIRTKKNKISGFFVGSDLVHNIFINDQIEMGYTLKSYYLFENHITFGYEYINNFSNNQDISFKVHSLNIGVQF